MTDKPLNCPCCGSKAYLANVIGRNGVCCENIECNVVLRGALDATEEDVIKAWNTRKPMDRIVEQLEAELYRGMESLEPVKIAFNFGINKAIQIVKATQKG